MVNKILQKGKDIFYGKQDNILSAATIIMIMIGLSRLLGLVRNRVFVHFFTPHTLDTYLAAFQLPDLIFEVLVVGAMSSAFIPVFTRYLSRGEKKEAWQVAGLTLNVMLLIFLPIVALIFIFAEPIYTVIARGFTPDQIVQTVLFTRILLLAQIFFVGSYVFTAVLESNQRFLAPAVAPLFYNLGIIVFTAFFAPEFGLMAPVFGAVAGSILHVLVQLPLAFSLGFRPVFALDFKNPALKKIGKLALPRIIELSFFQAKRLVDLSLASLIIGGITYFKFADSLEVLPTSLFGLSIAKASLPRMSIQTGLEDISQFKKTFISSLKQILFLVVPASIFLAILRIPLVRLAFGGSHFAWEDTLQTGYVLSAFTLGIFAYSAALLVARAFYALHDTATPVKVSFFTVCINIALAVTLIVHFKLPIWALALSYSIAGIIQVIILFILLWRRVHGFDGFGLSAFLGKIAVSSGLSGASMYFLLKVFDRSAWDKKLSFLGHFALPAKFDVFVIDTRYTVNLIALTIFVFLVGVIIYMFIAWVIKLDELMIILRVFERVSFMKVINFRKEAIKEGQTITPRPPYSNGSSTNT